MPKQGSFFCLTATTGNFTSTNQLLSTSRFIIMKHLKTRSRYSITTDLTLGVVLVGLHSVGTNHWDLQNSRSVTAMHKHTKSTRWVCCKHANTAAKYVCTSTWAHLQVVLEITPLRLASDSSFKSVWTCSAFWYFKLLLWLSEICQSPELLPCLIKHAAVGHRTDSNSWSLCQSLSLHSSWSLQTGRSPLVRSGRDQRSSQATKRQFQF